MNPGPLEELIFFDHPSGRNRIYAAMRWKAENLRLMRWRASGEVVAGAPSFAEK
jgi:STE24 endopeptidase